MIVEQKKTIEELAGADEILNDYRIACRSRQASLIGRREVLSGKAKFGIFGDGKEVAQVALANVFRPGDFRSGYYRDQTLMFALGLATPEAFFAQLYAHPDPEADPFSAGRQMNAHFATPFVNGDGRWKELADLYNISADVSPTGSQMPRLVGLTYASRLYRELETLHAFKEFSDNGNEIAFGTIGNASCAEGLFWEAINAIGVLGGPMVLSIWDDEYGISVPNEYQITKGNISELLNGFRREEGSRQGFDIYSVRGWDYPALVEIYQRAAEVARQDHIPSIIHVTEMTQPQGHSTSGSHERYKSAERLEWEESFDPIHKMREWILAEAIAPARVLDEIEAEEKESVEAARAAAWEAYTQSIRQEMRQAAKLIEAVEKETSHHEALAAIRRELLGKRVPLRRDMMVAIRRALMAVRDEAISDFGFGNSEPEIRNPKSEIQSLIAWGQAQRAVNEERYGSHLYSETEASALKVPVVEAVYSGDSPRVNGFEILNACFDAALARDPRVIAFGEDVGRLGDVNQGFAGLQAKYGELRVSDTGIREATIIGQAIGLALRGLRPIAEIQYLDYLLYALQIISDDLATLRWRTRGMQKAPVIIRTRGHRLEGVWHSGSPMAGVIHLMRGVHVLVPRDMTRAAGFYNTMLQSDDPALIVEVLNGYRLKERLPDNIGAFTVPLGVPEVLRPGDDVTVVTYGALCRIAMEAAKLLAEVGIEIELIDVQSLLPFDTRGKIGDSLRKTSRILFLDEDVPGGTTAYMMQEVLEKQGGYWWLDSEPRTLAAKPHRPAYGSDGSYFSKPNVEDIFDAVYELMNEADPGRYPMFYK